MLSVLKINKQGFIYVEMSVCTVPKTQNIKVGVRLEQEGYCWSSEPDLISACLLAAVQPLANVLWQYLAFESEPASRWFE